MTCTLNASFRVHRMNLVIKGLQSFEDTVNGSVVVLVNAPHHGLFQSILKCFRQEFHASNGTIKLNSDAWQVNYVCPSQWRHNLVCGCGLLHDGCRMIGKLEAVNHVRLLCHTGRAKPLKETFHNKPCHLFNFTGNVCRTPYRKQTGLLRKMFSADGFLNVRCAHQHLRLGGTGDAFLALSQCKRTRSPILAMDTECMQSLNVVGATQGLQEFGCATNRQKRPFVCICEKAHKNQMNAQGHDEVFEVFEARTKLSFIDNDKGLFLQRPINLDFAQRNIHRPWNTRSRLLIVSRDRLVRFCNVTGWHFRLNDEAFQPETLWTTLLPQDPRGLARKHRSRHDSETHL